MDADRNFVYPMPLHPDDVAATATAAASAQRRQLLRQAPVLSTVFRSLQQRREQRQQTHDRDAAAAALVATLQQHGGSAVLTSVRDATSEEGSHGTGSGFYGSEGITLASTIDLLSRSTALELRQLADRVNALERSLSQQREATHAAHVQGEQRAAQLETKLRSLQSQLLEQREEGERREAESRQMQEQIEEIIMHLQQQSQMQQQQQQQQHQADGEGAASARASTIDNVQLAPTFDINERKSEQPSVAHSGQRAHPLASAESVEQPSLARGEIQAGQQRAAIFDELRSSQPAAMATQEEPQQAEGGVSAMEPPSFDAHSADSSDNEGGADDDCMRLGGGGQDGEHDEPALLPSNSVSQIGSTQSAVGGSALMHGQPPSTAPWLPPTAPKPKAKSKPKSKRRAKRPAKKRRVRFSLRRDAASDEDEESDDDCSNYSSDSHADAADSDSEEEEKQKQSTKIRAPFASSKPVRSQSAQVASTSSASVPDPAAAASADGAKKRGKAGAASRSSVASQDPLASTSLPSRASSAYSFGSHTQPVGALGDDSHTPVVESEFGLRVLRPRRKQAPQRGGYVFPQF